MKQERESLKTQDIPKCGCKKEVLRRISCILMV